MMVAAFLFGGLQFSSVGAGEETWKLWEYKEAWNRIEYGHNRLSESE